MSYAGGTPSVAEPLTTTHDPATGTRLRGNALNRIVDAVTVLFFAALMVLPQSYFAVRAALLGLFLFVHLLLAAVFGRVRVLKADVLFYGLMALGGLVWAVIGLANGGYIEGVLASAKLYSVWTLAYLVILTLFRNFGSLESIHVAAVISTIAIGLLNIVAIVDSLLQTGLFSEAVIKELGMYVGLYGGYARLHANNIASMLFLMTYLIAYKMYAQKSPIRFGTDLAMLIGIVITVLSGRRALWLVVAIVPLLCVATALFVPGRDVLSRTGKRLGAAYAVAVLIAAAGFPLFGSFGQSDAGSYLASAFSAEDERTIQRGYLSDALSSSPVMGSGFGVSAGYVRSAEMPWLYELTYHQMLFNLGIAGCTALVAGFCYFLWLAVRGMRFVDRSELPIRVGILVGFVSMLLGSYSNPYLQLFDSMIYIMFFAYLFARPSPESR